MAERRRIIPLSVGPFIKQEEAKPEKPTPRFTLSLVESNERECPEFCFSELMKNALGENDEEQQRKKFNDLDEDDLTGITALARKFEQKYGPQKAKRKRQEIEDIIDVGLGYDEDDPFVDNSECYDELVPSMLDTHLGGFYINSGELKFKEIGGSSDDSDFKEHRKRKKNKSGKKKRSNSSEGHKREKKKHKSSLNDTPKKRGRKSHSGHDKKKKKEKSNPTIAELLQRKAHEGTDGIDKAVKKTITSQAEKNGIASSLEEDAADLIGSFNLPPLDSEMEQAMRDVMVDCENTMGGMVSDAEMSASANEADFNGSTYTKCPEGLEEPLKLNITRIKEAARKSEEGKCKFFSNEVNDLLLDIETQTRKLSCGTRSSVYSHLSHHLPCGKETLLKRAKKLRLGEQDNKLKVPLQKLREAVDRSMPSQLERYQEECQAAAQAKYDKMMDGKEKPEEAKSEEDDDGGDKTKRSFAPRKKFVWTDSLRNLLCELVILKVKAYEMLKSRTQSAEDYLKSFLEAEVKGFWPNGWMQTRMLFKESRSVHIHLTSTNSVKPKKPFQLLKKVQVNKKPASPVPPEMTSTSSGVNTVSVGSSYASSILKEMANTKGTANVHKDTPILKEMANTKGTANVHKDTPILKEMANTKGTANIHKDAPILKEMANTKGATVVHKDAPTLLDYANENNALSKYPIFSSTATANLSAANSMSKTSGTVVKKSPESGIQNKQHTAVNHFQTKEPGSHQVVTKSTNKNFNESFVNSLIARTLKAVEKTETQSVQDAKKDSNLQSGLSDLKFPDMSAAFELLAGAAMQNVNNSHQLNVANSTQGKSSKDKQTVHKTVNIIDKKAGKPLMNLAKQVKVTSMQSGHMSQQKSLSTSLSLPPSVGASLSVTQSPKWSGTAYLKMVDKTKQLPFSNKTQHKNLFHTIQDGKSSSKELSGLLPSKDVGSNPGVLNTTNKQFLTPQHVSPKRNSQPGYMQPQRSSNTNVQQRVSPSKPTLPQQVKPTNRTSPLAFNNRSPTESPSVNHSPMSPIPSPNSPSVVSARSLFHHPNSPQQTAAASMNLLGLNYGNNFSMQQLTGYQMQFADMAMKHTGNFTMPVGQGSPSHGLQSQSSSNQTSAEAVITGPAPGTFFYTQPSGSNPRFTPDSSGKMQHRIP